MKIENIANVYEQSPSSEVFFERDLFQDARWIGYSGLPINALEETIRRPRISRYRAAFQTALYAKRHAQTAVISHLPAMTAATASALRTLHASSPHFAFAFNFTELPIGSRKSYMRNCFASIRKFTVFSRHEALLYSDYFSLSENLFDFTLWTQNVPDWVTPEEIPFDGRYLCAVGGEDRDYELLARFSDATGIPVLIIGRPNGIPNLGNSPKVQFLYNQPFGLTWGYVKHSKGMVLPLKTNLSRCGQITLVSAAMLGVPTLAADTAGLKDYLDGDLQMKYEPGNLEDLIAKAKILYNSSEEMTKVALGMQAHCLARYDRRHWTHTMEKQLSEA